jgi:putative ABC transport system ATP-binding protein
LSSPTSPNSPLAIDLSGVRFAYGKGAPVLDIADFRLLAGQSCFLYGPSGSGKTTLLGILAGVIQPQSGQVKVLGQSLDKLSSAKRDAWRGTHLGYIFQMFNLIPYLSVEDNIQLPCRLHKARLNRLGQQSPQQATQNLAQALGIAPLLQRNVLELSVGQQQRVAAARALIGAPELVIADEPTSALDTAHRERFLQLLLEQTRLAGSTLLFVSHDQSLAPLFDRQVSLLEINKAAVEATL